MKLIEKTKCSAVETLMVYIFYYACIYICMHKCTHVYMYICTCIYVQYMYMCMCTCVYCVLYLSASKFQSLLEQEIR